MKLFKKLSLKFKINFSVFVAMLILAVLVLIGVNQIISTQVAEKIISRDAEMGYQLLEEEYSGNWSKRGNKLYKGETLINDNIKLVNQIKNITGGIITVFAGDTRIATNLKKSDGSRAVGTKISKKIKEKVLDEGEIYSGESELMGKNHFTYYQPIENSQGEAIGIWSAAISQEVINQIMKTITFWVIVIFIVSQIIVQILLSLYLNNLLFNPLDKIIAVTNKVAEGNLKTSLDLDREDEMGDLSTAVEGMTINLKNIITNILDSVEDLSAYSEELSASAEESNATIDTTSNNINEIASGIQQVSASSQEVTGLAQEATSKAEIGNENINQTVSNIEEINSAVNEAVEVINELDNNSDEIGEIVEMITNIAEQTNLLALNAAIEAARAGEHGQGFAVVADEIRGLAEETSQATEKIANIVRDTQEKSSTGIEVIEKVSNKAQAGKEIVKDTGEVFNTINDSIEETSEQIEQVSAVAEEVADNSEEIKEAIQNVNDMSDEVTNSSQQLSEMAQDLQQMLDKFEI